MSRPYRYLHLDVFTRDRFAGNQLAVVLDGRGLDTALMQAIAREMAFSETTFVLPPTEAGTAHRVRIFTPGTELPMAGHPTVGTTFALAHEGRIDAGRPSVTLGLGVGPTPVALDWVGGRLDFAWMSQRAPTFGPVIEDVDALAGALGVDAEDIRATGLPVHTASAGVPFLYVPMQTRAAVDRARSDAGALSEVGRATGLGEPSVFLFSTERGADEAMVYARMFAPGLGVAEDPATGSACGPLGAYLVRHGAVTASEAGAILVLQGAKMGRPSWVHLDVQLQDADLTGVRVGGHAVVVASGTMDV